MLLHPAYITLAMNKNALLKKALRAQLRQQRNRLPLSAQKEKAIQLCQRITRLPDFIHSQCIAAYWPRDGEIDPMPLLHQAHSMGKQCYLSVICPPDEQPEHPKVLGFLEYHPGDSLTPNQFGILEMSHRLDRIIPAAALDLICIPLTAFDANGNRLGMGGGYYDRALAFMRTQAPNQKPYLLGLAYEIQRIPEAPSDNWDIRLHGIATEAHYYTPTNPTKMRPLDHP